MRIGVFGGTFDPVHLGHLILAETVRCSAQLDRVVFLPAKHPPHKMNQVLTPAPHRLAMLNLALRDYPELEVTDFEIQRERVSYTIDTLAAMQQEPEFRNESLLPIIGGDSLAEFHTWKFPDQIVRKYQVLCVHRPDFHIEHVNPSLLSKIQMIEAPLISISSSEIRSRVKRRESIRFLVPDAVESYILMQGFYL